ncbi:Exportin-6 [Hondaea fermentalgiana]|uniref:Exportin-6 n=1 Tax=Hondaea fermentalgiana TaxID=2315210 RepID=A0A2R5G6T3_9STRA|nr:Exportin-6 [Hondaea fermentalgiana]|eukprot:GBG26767.1 Exportin-6 [Hondaea fermentalgiana]
MISIGELEQAVNRLFDPSTANDEKRRIENGLSQLRESAEGVELSCQILNDSKNEYAIWFACLSLEHVVQTRWTSVTKRDEVRSFVMRYALRQHGGALPKYIVTKLAKVVVEMAKHDWPKRYPSFLQDIMSACAQSDETTSTAGLQILLLAIEEFALENSKAVVTSTRQKELRELLKRELPGIINIVSNVLRHGLGTSNVTEGRTLPRVSLAFSILQQVLAWAQLSQVLNGEVMDAVFRYMTALRSVHAIEALMCINEMLDKNLVPRDAVDFVLRVAMAALETLQILAGGNDASALEACAQGFVPQYTRFLSILLRKYLRKLETVPNFSVSSFAELLATYTLRQESVEDFLFALELWSVYTTYVREDHEQGAQSQAASAYLQVLCHLMMKLVERVLWSRSEDILDLIEDETPEAGQNRNSADTLTDGGNASSTHAGSSGEDDQPVTEFERYISRIVALVSEIGTLPAPYEGPAYEPLFMEAGRHLQQGLETLTPLFGQLSQNQTVPSDTMQRFAHAASDVATLMQIVSQLAPWLVVPGRFSSLFDAALQYMRWALELIEAMNTNRVYTCGPSFVRLQVRALELASSMCPWLQKLGQLANAVLSTSGEVNESDRNALQANASARDFVGNFDHVAVQIIEHALSSLMSKFTPLPEEISLAGIDLFASVCVHVVPSRILEYPPIQRVTGNLAEFSAGLAIRPRSKLYVAVSKMTLAPPVKRPSAAERDKIKSLYEERIGPVVHSLKQLVEQCAAQAAQGTPSARLQHAERCRPLLTILVAICQDAANNVTTTKQLVSSVVLPALPTAVHFISVLMKPAADLAAQGAQLSNDQQRALRRGVTTSLGAARDALDFVVASLGSFSRQAGKDACLQTVSELVDVFARQNIAQSIAENGSGGPLLLLKLVRLFVALLGDSSPTFEPVLPKILSLCLYDVSKVAAGLASKADGGNQASTTSAEHAIDLLEAQYDLIHTVLRWHWRWFSDNQEGKNFFSQAMELLLQSLEMQSLPPHVFRRNLAIFDDLQKTVKLYSSETFLNDMRPVFTTTLLKLLATNTREILQDEVLITVYGLAAVNLDGFFDTIIPRFAVEYATQIRGHQQVSDAAYREVASALAGRPTDMPSFIIALRAFGNDIRVLF